MYTQEIRLFDAILRHDESLIQEKVPSYRSDSEKEAFPNKDTPPRNERVDFTSHDRVCIHCRHCRLYTGVICTYTMQTSLSGLVYYI